MRLWKRSNCSKNEPGSNPSRPASQTRDVLPEISKSHKSPMREKNTPKNVPLRRRRGTFFGVFFSLIGDLWLLDISGSTSLVCEAGLEGLLPGSFFEQLDLFQSRYKRDSLTRSREFLYTLYLPKISANLEKSIERCPAPVLEIMMNAVLATDADYSTAEARALYELTLRMANDAGSNQVVKELLRDWESDTV